MKTIIKSFIIAFSMYSKIPMPKVEWSKDNMRYVMCFFPLIGLIIGGFIYLWYIVSQTIPVSPVFRAVLMVVIPLIITGGIHMDGFLDTVDALCSYRSKQEKLVILKDPHAGAFAVIACVSYLLLTFGIWYDVTSDAIPCLTITFVLSRSLSGLSVVTFPLAKNSGLATMFSNESSKNITRIVIFLHILFCIIAMLLLNRKLGLIAFFSSMIVFFYYYRMSAKEFGGITGDIAGYFLQICELIMAFAIIMGDKI